MPPSDDQPKRRLRVFLCHSSGDKPSVRQLCEWLERDGFDPWLDEKKLLPAQRWADVIEDAVRASDVVVVCLSAGSVSKEGFLQREIKFALQIADEKPEDTIYIVPTRLEPVDLPRRFRELQAANLYESGGYERLKESLAQRAAQIAAAPSKSTSGPRILQPPTADESADKFKRAIRLPRWVETHPRLLALGLLLVVGGTSFAGYSLYQKQKRQRTLASQLYSDGIASWKALELRKAADLLSQAAAAEPGDPTILAAYALSLNERGRELEAREVAKRAINSDLYISSDARNFVEGVYNETIGNWQKAEEIYSRLWQSGGHDLESGLRLAHVQTLGGAPLKALDTLQQISAPASDDPRVVLEKATAQDSLGHFKDEPETLRPLIEEHPTRDLIRALALAERCWAEYDQRDNDVSLNKASTDCKDAEDIFNDKEDAVGQARTLTRQAVILAAQASNDPEQNHAATLYQQALEMQNRAIGIAKERGAIRDEAGGLQNLANILMEQSQPDPEAAGTQYKKSKELFQSLGDRDGVAGVDNDAAVRQIDLCRYREALTSAERAQQNWSAIGSANEAIALANMGSMQLYLGDVSEGEKNLRAALSKTQGKLSVDTKNWLITLGETYMEEAKFDLAEQCFKGGPCYDDRELSTVHGDKVLADAVLDYANLEIERGRAAEAERLAASALKSAQTANDHDEEIKSRNVLANALLAEGSDSGLKRARTTVQGIAPSAVEDCRVRVALHLTLAKIAGRSGDLAKQDEELGQVLGTAHDLGLTRYVLEATLEQAGASLRSGQFGKALQEANEVLKQLEDRGLLFLKPKALELVRRAEMQSEKANS